METIKKYGLIALILSSILLLNLLMDFTSYRMNAEFSGLRQCPNQTLETLLTPTPTRASAPSPVQASPVLRPPYDPIPPLLLRPPQKLNQNQSFEHQALVHNLSPYQASPLHPDNYRRLQQYQYQNVTPRLLHFVFVADLDGQHLSFNFINYLVIRASYFRLQPDYIYLHTNKPPLECPIWHLIKPMIDQVKHFEPELEIYGNKVSGKAHISDIQRLRALQKYGGIYMDIDSVAIRYFPESIWTPSSGMSMGWENEELSHMGVSMISSAKDSKFLQRWIESYKTFNDKKWADHTVLISGKLTREFPEEINTLPEVAFNRPGWYKSTIGLLWDEKPITDTGLFEFKETYASHYWGSFARSFGKISRMTPQTVLQENVGIHQILRPILPNPYISIVIKCKNNDESFMHSIKSVVPQTFPLWEIILLENSTDKCSPELTRMAIKENPRLSLYLPASIRVIQSKGNNSSGALGIWRVELEAGEILDESTALNQALESIRDNPESFVHQVQTRSKRKPLEFCFRPSSPLVRLYS